MKKSLIIILMFMIVLSTGCMDSGAFADKEEVEKMTDAEKFKEEYPVMPVDNVYEYVNAEEAIKILENGTGLIYIGFPECQWCQAYISMLNGVVEEQELDKVSYLNIKDDRSNDTEEYKKIVSILDEYLDFGDDGNKRIFVPTVVAVVDGEIIGFDDETSHDIDGYNEPDDYWTEEKRNSLINRLEDIVRPVYNASCGECNL